MRATGLNDRRERTRLDRMPSHERMYMHPHSRTIGPAVHVGHPCNGVANSWPLAGHRMIASGAFSSPPHSASQYGRPGSQRQKID